MLSPYVRLYVRDFRLSPYDAPQPDDSLTNVEIKKILHYRQLLRGFFSSCCVHVCSVLGSIVRWFLVSTFLGFSSFLTGELSEESDHFRLSTVSCVFGQSEGISGIDLSQGLGNEGYYYHPFIYVVFHTSPSILSLSSCTPCQVTSRDLIFFFISHVVILISYMNDRLSLE